MKCKSLPKIEKSLATALDAFDWKQVKAEVGLLIGEIRKGGPPLCPDSVKRILAMLRSKRRLDLLAAVAEALLESGERTAVVQRQYAQALIDLGYLTPAERMLESLVPEVKGTEEEPEARGLIARIHKQIYVNRIRRRKEPGDSHLERALNEYLYAYRLAPQTNLWHGINVVALASLAQRDGRSLAGMPNVKAVAKDILAAIGEAKRPTAWDRATAMEAHLALGDSEGAFENARAYTDSQDVDAFAINSTLRQMSEVWGLTESKPPGSHLLPLLRAALMMKEGSRVTLDADQAKADLRPKVRADLEKVFGNDAFLPLKSYQMGLERAKSVARIERPNGQGHGTGWLVRGEDFFPDQQGKMLVVTNHHVVSDPPYPGALRPRQAKVHFQMLNLMLDADEIVWTSPPNQCDATFLSLKKKPGNAAPLELAEDQIEMSDPPPRVFLIGHPGGRDLEFSIEDNRLIGVNQTLLHYRTPTQGGSSGSPVFEDQEWRVVALHHAGRDDMQRIDGKKGTYQANEGISVEAIRKAAAKRRV
jgi:hypothetical protein